jgi:Cu+-exporting ATPase
MKVVDPVCKMTIDSAQAAATSECKGQTVYFCAKGCKAKFDAAPEKYLGK